MSTKTAFAMLALLCWMLSFCVITVSALKADCFFLHESYPKKVLFVALLNMVCVVYFIAVNFYSKQNIGEE